MKNFYSTFKYFITFLLTFLISFSLHSQCNNGTNYYPSSVYDPLVGSWGFASSCNWAGEVIQVNIINGDTYEFSTCDGQGGVLASYDTQLTLFDATGAVVAFNDDYSGCSGYTSYLSYTATYDGILYVHLTEYNCVANQVCTKVMIQRTEAQTGGGGAGNNGTYQQVGNDNSTTTNGRVPAYGYYDYSWSAAIYTPADMGGQAIYIDKLSWDVANSVTATLTNQEIYLGLSTANEFPDGTCPEDGNGPWNQWLKVYSGDITWTPGWNEITLDQSYIYDGTQSLIVKVINNDGSWTSSYPEFRYTAKSNSVVYNYGDGTFPSFSGYRNSYRPNMRFNFGGGALPITLGYFDAWLSDDIHNSIVIEWSTHSQQNNDYFTIYKSYDGFNWFELSKTQGAGNANELLHYSSRDYHPRPGVQYYKLRQTDYDGQWEEFDVVSVIIKPERKEVVKAYNQMGQEVSIDTKGLIFCVWDNGDVTKTIND
jgi:hypothetical protein